jgi:hypothetical protein
MFIVILRINMKEYIALINSTDVFVFVMETHCVFCDVGTEISNFRSKSLGFQRLIKYKPHNVACFRDVFYISNYRSRFSPLFFMYLLVTQYSTFGQYVEPRRC